ncbi:MAG TPA: PQQ-binding-like beta-propeller repeat protein [Terriglobales bacterium]|nr:PQQ-binding-like beta-propeller repeat protein [Terriglobales bacterium]
MKKLFPLILILAITAFAQDGVMFRGNPQHGGIYDSAAIPRFTEVKWKFKTHGQVFSSPALANGVVYIGSGDHFLYAIDAESGAQKWKFQTGSRVTSSPAVAGGTVFFGSFDSMFYAVDAASGKLKWKFQTAGERRFIGTHLHGSEPASEPMPDPFDFYLSSPAVSNGVVYFGSGDTNVYALDAATGSLKWKFKTADVVHASPAIADGTVFVGSWDSYFYALDAATGREKWKFKTGEDPKIHNQVGIQASATVADGIVYFGCRDSNFYALDENTGQKRWTMSNHGSWVISSAVVQNGKIYFGTSDSGLFHALDAKTGAPVFSLKMQGWPMFSSPAVAGNMLYIGSHEGKLVAVDLTSQQIAWTFQTDGSRQNGPTYTKPDGTPKYEAAFEDNFYDDIVVGVQRMMQVGAVLSSPVVANRVIYFGSADGNVYAIR